MTLADSFATDMGKFFYIGGYESQLVLWLASSSCRYGNVDIDGAWEIFFYQVHGGWLP